MGWPLSSGNFLSIKCEVSSAYAVCRVSHSLRLFYTPGKTAWCEVDAFYKSNEAQPTIIQSVYQVSSNNGNWDFPRHPATRVRDDCKGIATGA